MVHLTDALGFRDFRVSHHSVIFLLLIQASAGWLTGPSQPIIAIAGDDIILPCHMGYAMVSGRMVIWERPDLSPKYVYVKQNDNVDVNYYHNLNDGVELEREIHPSYKGRTSLSIDKLEVGDVSLKISKVKRSDEGRYMCSIGRMLITYIDLVVASDAVSTPVISVMSRSGGRVVLQCESKGWYPEPEVIWLDGEGYILSPEATKTVSDPDDLYTVGSRVTVEKRHSNNFTCRVQQKDINQIRETHIYVPADANMAPVGLPLQWTIVLGVSFVNSFIL